MSSVEVVGQSILETKREKKTQQFKILHQKITHQFYFIELFVVFTTIPYQHAIETVFNTNQNILTKKLSKNQYFKKVSTKNLAQHLSASKICPKRLGQNFLNQNEFLSTETKLSLSPLAIQLDLPDY